LLVIALVIAACAPTPSVPTSATGTAPIAEATATEAADAATTPVATTAQADETATTEPAETAAATEPAATTEATAETGGAADATGTPETDATAATGDGAVTTGADGIANVTYTGVEYSFEGPDQIPAGWTRLTLDNQGQANHDLQVFKLEAGKTLEDVTQALAGEGPPDWVQAYGSAAAAAGTQSSFIVELTPGDYVLLSFGDSEQGPPDAAQGMIKMVTVTEAAATPDSVQLPEPDVTIDMVDFSFVMTGTVQAGNQTVMLTNSGVEPHEAQIFKLNEGTTFEQFQQMLLEDTVNEQTPFPAEFAWGMILAPDVTAYSEMNLTSGEYAVVCFIPSPANEGKPHYMLGMIQPLTVE
jgi:hypothetical protein